MSKELEVLMQRVRLRQYEKSPPKKLLIHILDEIERKQHYGRMRSWELMVEFLARWLVLNKETEKKILMLAGYPSCLPFHGLPLKTNLELYQHIDKLDLFKHYYTAAKKQPWDYIGEVYMEQGLVGPGQNMTPKAIVDFMTKAVHPDPWVYEAEVFCFTSLVQYIMEHEVFYHMPPHHLKPVEVPVKTQLDPAVGTGRFLLEASQLYPKAPLRLYGIEISLPLYRACLVNMAIMSNHPYYIICADTLRLGPVGSNSPVWRLANRWNPPDVSQFYAKPPPITSTKFTLSHYAKLRVKNGKHDKNV